MRKTGRNLRSQPDSVCHRMLALSFAGSLWQEGAVDGLGGGWAQL